MMGVKGPRGAISGQSTPFRITVPPSPGRASSGLHLIRHSIYLDQGGFASMAEDVTGVLEETYENEPTGVEVERDDDQQPETAKPWRPEDIRVGTKQFSLRNILDLIDDGDLELAPDFQRNTVWKAKQKSRRIDSIRRDFCLAFHTVFRWKSGASSRSPSSIRSKMLRSENCLVPTRISSGRHGLAVSGCWSSSRSTSTPVGSFS